MVPAGSDVLATTSGTPEGPPQRRWRDRRVIAMSVWVALALLGLLTVGLPTDPLFAFVWMWSGVIAWNIHRPWRSHLRFVRDWAPILLLLIGYNLSRGLADNGVTPHVTELITADLWLTGWFTGDVVLTVWLQERFYTPDAVQWWDVVASWVYFSHFVAALAIAVVLYLRSRPLWRSFMTRWIFLSMAGLVTYFLYPAAPPWWAAEYGYLEPVDRISTRGWGAIGLEAAGNVLNVGQAASNPIAAMPSLHTAFALFVVAFFFPRVRGRWIPVLLLYPLAMTFTLVYSAEHYIIDVLVGWLYVGLTFLVVGVAERWWARYQRLTRARAADGGEEHASDGPTGSDGPVDSDSDDGSHTLVGTKGDGIQTARYP